MVDKDGFVYDLANALSGNTFVGAHAGLSHWLMEGTEISNFNKRSIGIEIVNVNGNLVEFTEQQYIALKGLINNLKELYPNINHPDTLIGHDQIAGFRGKADPGILFKWERLKNDCFPEFKSANDGPKSTVPEEILSIFKEKFLAQPPIEELEAYDSFWHDMNYLMEKSVILYHNSIPADQIINFINKSIP